MSFLDTYDEQSRQSLRRKMHAVTASELEHWLSIEPREWVLRHGPTLHAAGLSAQDGEDLYRRLGADTAALLSPLVDAGRMADIDIRYIHLWAASGLLSPSAAGQGGTRSPRRRGTVTFTRWVSAARQYITVCGGDQHLAALSAAAGLSLEETRRMRADGELLPEPLEILVAFREANLPR